MKKLQNFLVILLFTLTTTINVSADNIIPIDNNISELLKNKFKKNPHSLLKYINNKKFLRNFYYKNHYQPLWLEHQGLNKEKYNMLFEHINNDLTLNPNGYLLKTSSTLSKHLDDNLTIKQLFRIELKLTSLYHDFLNHAIYGEIQWKNFNNKLSSLKRYRINGHWVKKRPKFNIPKLLLNSDINQTLEEVKPKEFGYEGLLTGLTQLNVIKDNGGWKKLPYFKVLKLRSTGERVLQLRERLKASGDYISCSKDSNNSNIPQENIEINASLKDKHIDHDAIFGECLEYAVKNFQKRHGLTVDGIVGGGTQRALNISVEEKIKTVLLNIDRIKWLPRNKDERYLIANLPEFMLHYIEDNKIKKQIRIIIGDKKHPTPIFNQTISYVVLNPYWKVPEGIVRREIVPAMIKNPNYLKKQGLVAHRTWSEKSRIINVSGLYWEQYLWKGVRFPYRLMQPPGPRNALGKIKFKFPNRFAVYLHDTPTRHLFKRDIRAFSHGCVRISEPKALFDIVASFNSHIELKRANKILKGKRKVQYNLKNKLPIYLVYLTAGMNSKNQLEFRNDIYNYDKYQKRSIK